VWVCNEWAIWKLWNGKLSHMLVLWHFLSKVSLTKNQANIRSRKLSAGSSLLDTVLPWHDLQLCDLKQTICISVSQCHHL
jgi:hypothetical protein